MSDYTKSNTQHVFPRTFLPALFTNLHVQTELQYYTHDNQVLTRNRACTPILNKTSTSNHEHYSAIPSVLKQSSHAKCSGEMGSTLLYSKRELVGSGLGAKAW